MGFVHRWLPDVILHQAVGWYIQLSFLFVWSDSLHPSQDFFSYVGTDLHGLNQYLARINVSCSRTQCSDAGEAQAHNPSVSNQALNHSATTTTDSTYK